MADFLVIPAHNEENRINNVINRSKQYLNNIIVVDDGSTDNTTKEAKNCKVVVLRHKVNLGKGAALKTGCDYALSKGAKKIVVIDADGQHDPNEIPNFILALEKKDIIFSYRKQNERMPSVLRFGNWFINNSINKLFNIKIKDSQCGYRAFTAETYKKIRWNASDYYMETEMIIKSGKNKLNYGQLPIETIYADKYKGTTVFDGVKIVTSMFLWRLFK
jgi:glycosyltransferase involved in cell wall biosynthesis